MKRITTEQDSLTGLWYYFINGMYYQQKGFDTQQKAITAAYRQKVN